MKKIAIPIIILFLILFAIYITAIIPTVTDDMILVYHFDNDSAFGENDTHIFDFSNSQNNGTVVGAVFNASGRFGGAFDFDGINDQINIGANAENTLNFNISHNFTWSMWVNVKDNTNNVRYGLFETITGSVGRSLIIALNQSRYVFVGTLKNDMSTEDIITSNSSLSPGTWYHIVVTYLNQTVVIYINGTLENSGNLPEFGTDVADQNKIGNEELFDANSCNCSIDEVIVYNKTLTDTEVLNLYEDYILITNITTCGNLNAANKEYTLLNDVNSSGTCFSIQSSNITLDCQGNNITYGNAGSDDSYGLTIEGKEDVTIKNCKIILGNLTISGVSPDASYGFYPKTSSDNFKLINSTIITATRENYGVFIETSDNGQIINSTIEFSFGTAGFSNPNPVSVDDSLNISIIDSRLNLTDGKSFSNNGTISVSTSEVILINTTYLGEQNEDIVDTTQKSNLTRKWYFNGLTNYSHNSTAVNNVNITAYRVLGNVEFSALTDGNGEMTRQEITEYFNDEGTIEYFTNYTINATLSNWDTDSISLNITSSIIQQFLINDSTFPNVTIEVPKLGEEFDFNDSISLNVSVTDLASGLDTCYFNIDNGANITLSNCANTTINTTDGSHTLNFFANDTANNLNKISRSFTVSLTGPAITLDSPTNNSFFNNGTNIYLNYTTTDQNGIDTVEIHHDFNGSFSLNQTNTEVTSGQQNFSISNVTADNFYTWTVFANDTSGNGRFSATNFTFTIDTILPIVNINLISATTGSQTITINSTITDVNTGTCKYLIHNSTGGVDGLNNNISFTCDTNNQATVTTFGTFNLTVFSTDLAGNEGKTTKNFTVIASSINIGGGGTIIIEGFGLLQALLAQNHSITNTLGGNTLDFVLAKGSVRRRSKEFIIINTGINPIELNLVCDTTILDVNLTENIKEGIDICDFVTFEEDKITVSPNEDDPTRGRFFVTVPPNASFSDKFSFNILALRNIGGNEVTFSKLSVTARVPFWAVVLKFSLFPFSESRSYPVAIPSFVFAFVIFSAIVLATRKSFLVAGLVSGFIVSVIVFIIGLVVT